MILGNVASAHVGEARFLALGDSYTIGEGVAAEGRWPNQLADALRKSGVPVAAAEIVARTGWTTDELAAAMDKHAFRPPYDLVTLLIGVNNQYRAGQEPKCPEGQGGPRGAARQEPQCEGHEPECREGHGQPGAAPEGQGGPRGAAGQEPQCEGHEPECREGHGRPGAAPEGQAGPRGAGRDLDNYRTEFRALLQRAIALAGGRAAHVVVVSIPDWGATGFGRSSGRDTAQIAREIDMFNAANRAIAADLHAQYADVTLVSRDGGNREDQLVGDGLHPSAAMYARWLAQIVPAAQRALTAR